MNAVNPDGGVASATVVLLGCFMLAALAPAMTRSYARTTARSSESELFILPRNYKGPFIAIYGQPGGQVAEYRHDTAVYQVPASGVVRIGAEEPARSTAVFFAFVDSQDVVLPSFATCADMREKYPGTGSGACWLDFAGGGTGVPDHVVAVVTDWNHLPECFNRTTLVYDSVLFDGKGRALRKWEEPKRAAPIRRSELIAKAL